MSLDKRHGGPYDRGRADNYYRREYRPHYFTGATRLSEEIFERHMTEREIAEYSFGFYENELSGDKKDWG